MWGFEFRWELFSLSLLFYQATDSGKNKLWIKQPLRTARARAGPLIELQLYHFSPCAISNQIQEID